ncbi:MAG: aggregation factor core [Pseudomonadota bacterium]
MAMKRAVWIGLGAILATASAQADVSVWFYEGAPKDRFEVRNESGCDLSNVLVSIDLRDSAGRLYFDTTGAGAGVEVFQPFESRRTDLSLDSAEAVQDGDTALRVRIDALADGARASFTIDVDDALTDSALGQIRVADSEMSGARVELLARGLPAREGQFDGNLARVEVESSCQTG